MTKTPYRDRSSAIVSALKTVAQGGKTITYAELAAKVGMPPQGPWTILDEICEAEIQQGRPDLTFLVVQKMTGLPSKINGASAKRPTLEQRAAAEGKFKELWALYS